VGRVLGTGACTGCAGCVLACPRGVLDLDQDAWEPRLAAVARVEGDGCRCTYSSHGCTMCARACPRFGAWEDDADRAVRGRARTTDEVLGIHRGIVLAAATDPAIATAGQDGGLASALLVYALEHGVIDAALVSGIGPGLRPRPVVARSREEVLAAAGSRYTYSPNLLAAGEAATLGAARLGLVTVGCQASVPAVARSHGARRLAGRFALNIGLLCSRTFTDDLFPGLLAPGYGVAREQVTRMNIKGKLQVWSGSPAAASPDLEVALKECDPFGRPGCRHCPDFAAEHADISLGGIGRQARTTLAIVRSDLGAGLLEDMARDGWIAVRDAGADDPEAVALVTRMAARQRRRWAALAEAQAGLDPGPGRVPATAKPGISPPGPPGSGAGPL
jgi:coenzyme F420 hydrogenase subunit beta